MSTAVVIVVPQGAPVWAYVLMIVVLLMGLIGIAIMSAADVIRDRRYRQRYGRGKRMRS